MWLREEAHVIGKAGTMSGEGGPHDLDGNPYFIGDGSPGVVERGQEVGSREGWRGKKGKNRKLIEKKDKEKGRKVKG